MDPPSRRRRTACAHLLLWIRTPLMAAALGCLLVPGWTAAVGLPLWLAAVGYIALLGLHLVAHGSRGRRWEGPAVYASLLADLAVVTRLAAGGDQPLPGLLVVLPLLALFFGALFPSAAGLVPPVLAALSAAAAGLLSGARGLEPSLQAALAALTAGLCGAVGMLVELRLRADDRRAAREADERTERALKRQRERLARELHDTAGRTLAGAGLVASQLHHDTGSDRADELVALLHEGNGALRQVLGAMRGQLNLAEAISHEAEAAGRRHGVEVDCHLAAELPTVSAEAALALLRVAQEALTNAARHARCRTVRVSLRPHHNGLRLRIADDGDGFDPDLPAPGHFGLTGMKERADEVGAALEIASAPGRGTTVTVTLPHPS